MKTVFAPKNPTGAAIRRAVCHIALVITCALSAADESDPAQPKGDTLVLSPFTVSMNKDNGYIAADTLNAGRLSTKLILTPSDTTVLTRDFLNDIGALDMAEASAWLTSAQANELGSGGSPDTRDFGTGTTQRGMVTQRNTRNYFATSSTPEEYVVERMEGARGPNAILYGDGGPGGQVNYLTKRALSYNKYRLRVRADNEGSTEFSADLNQRFSDKLAARYNGRSIRGKNWVEGFFDNRTGSAINVTYRPWKNSEIRFDGELNYINRAHRTDNYLDQSSLWNGVGLEGSSAATPAGSGITRFPSGSPTWIYIEGLGLLDWRGFGRSSGTGLAILPFGSARDLNSFPVLPRESFNAQPYQMRTTNHQSDAQLTFEQKFESGLATELAFAYSNTDKKGAALRFNNAFVDVNKTMPGGAANPNYGKLFSSSDYGFDIDGTIDTWAAGRAAANYPLRVGDIVQNISLVVQSRQQRANLKNHRAYRTDSNPNVRRAAANVITIYRYWDDLAENIPENFENVPMATVTTRDSMIFSQLQSVQLNTTGVYLDERLSLIAGLRRDYATRNSRDIATVNPVSGEGATTTNSAYKGYSNSYSAGIVYFPWKPLGFYVNYSEGFVGQAGLNPMIDGTPFNSFIVPSKNESAGIRLRLLDGKVVGTAGYYTSKETNRILNVNVRDINDLLNRHGEPEILTFANTQISDFSSVEGWGWEGEITASISNRFRMTANLGFPQTKQSDTATGLRAYVDLNRAKWQAYAADLANPTRVADATSLANIENTLASFNEGRELNGNYKYRANIYGNYTFDKGVAKGLSVGLGAQFYGRRLIGNEIGKPYDYVYMKPYSIVTGTIAYAFQLNGAKAQVQLNVLNVMDFRDPIFASTAVVGNALYPNTYTYQAPRTFRLTVGVEF